MNFLKPFFEKFLSTTRRPTKSLVLGRWRIESCDLKMNQKIDLSNEDHCGPCGQYLIQRRIFFNPTSSTDFSTK